MATRFLVVVCLLAAWGCGLKGDLYLPEQSEQPAQTPPSSPNGEVDRDEAEDGADERELQN